jgi:hypothetical protein
MLNPRGRTSLILLVLLACTACSGSGTGGAPASRPTADPTTSLAPVSAGGTAGPGERTVWGLASIVLPAGFTPVEVPSTDVVHRFGAKAGRPGGPAVIAVVIQDAPTRKAAAEAAAGAQLARSAVGGRARNVQLRQLSLPGATDAWALEYDETPATGSSAGAQLHSASVTADVGDRVVVIQARASVTEYPESGLATALTSAQFTS